MLAHTYQESEAENLREFYIPLPFHVSIGLIFFETGVCWRLLNMLVSSYGDAT